MQQQIYQKQGHQKPPSVNEPVDLTAPADMQDRAEIAVAFSASTGAVGVMSFAYRQSQTHYHFMAAQNTFAHASCLSRALNQKLGKVNLTQAERFVKKHHKKSDSLHENLIIIILKGKLPNGQYQLFMATRNSNRHPFSQEQPEYRSLFSQCQAQATNCEMVGQFGQTTELY